MNAIVRAVNRLSPAKGQHDIHINHLTNTDLQQVLPSRFPSFYIMLLGRVKPTMKKTLQLLQLTYH